MTRERKTVDVWEIQGNYGYSWDMICYEDSWRDAKAQLRCYIQNEPRADHRIKHRRIPKDRYAKGDF